MTFSDQSAISAHYDTAHAQSSSSSRPEHPDARHECEVCGRKFTTRRWMRHHIAHEHGVGDAETFQCDICSYVAKRKSHLKMHLSAVHGLGDAKTFQCDVCSYVAKHKSNIKRHLSYVHGIGGAKTF